MNLWRSLVRWLARKEIESAFEAGAVWQGAVSAPNVKIMEALAYARGELAGHQAALDALDSPASCNRVVH